MILNKPAIHPVDYGLVLIGGVLGLVLFEAGLPHSPFVALRSGVGAGLQSTALVSACCIISATNCRPYALAAFALLVLFTTAMHRLAWPGSAVSTCDGASGRPVTEHPLHLQDAHPDCVN